MSERDDKLLAEQITNLNKEEERGSDTDDDTMGEVEL